MRKGFFVLLLVVLLPLGANAAADNFIYPMNVWRTATQHGQVIGGGSLYHMGVDAGFDQGTGAPIYAIADGVVREVRTRTRFGLVILIEHELPNSNEIVSLYGHLEPSTPQVQEGQTVQAGKLIGFLGRTEVNGGWSPHIHFGIHKEPYTGVWKYTGHVTNPAIIGEWYDPVDFIPARLTKDIWNPEVSFDFSEGQTVADTFVLDVLATDLGSGVQSVSVEASDDGKKTWETVASYSGDARYPTSFFTSLAGFKDGRVYLRVSATDGFGRVGNETTFVRLKANADTINHLTAVRGGKSKSRNFSRAQSGGLLGEFKTSSGERIQSVTDVAVGDVTGNGAKNIVTVKVRDKKTKVVVQSKGGATLDRFSVNAPAFKKSPRVAVGDVDSDGVDEIILGSGPGAGQEVRVYERDGTLVWRRQPFNKSSQRGVDVAAGDMDGDGDDEVIVGMRAGGKSKVIQLAGDGTRGKVFRVFGRKYKGGVNVAAGDIDNDGVDEIVVGSAGERKGQVVVVEPTGKKKKTRFTPFGRNFTGPVDVSTTDWEEDGKAEIMMSQAGNGDAWVKTYRFTSAKRVVFQQRVFEEGFEDGARITGW